MMLMQAIAIEEMIKQAEMAGEEENFSDDDGKKKK